MPRTTILLLACVVALFAATTAQQVKLIDGANLKVAKGTTPTISLADSVNGNCADGAAWDVLMYTSLPADQTSPLQLNCTCVAGNVVCPAVDFSPLAGTGAVYVEGEANPYDNITFPTPTPLGTGNESGIVLYTFTAYVASANRLANTSYPGATVNITVTGAAASTIAASDISQINFGDAAAFCSTVTWDSGTGAASCDLASFGATTGTRNVTVTVLGLVVTATGGPLAGVYVTASYSSPNTALTDTTLTTPTITITVTGGTLVLSDFTSVIIGTTNIATITGYSAGTLSLANLAFGTETGSLVVTIGVAGGSVTASGTQVVVYVNAVYMGNNGAGSSVILNTAALNPVVYCYLTGGSIYWLDWNNIYVDSVPSFIGGINDNFVPTKLYARSITLNSHIGTLPIQLGVLNYVINVTGTQTVVAVTASFTAIAPRHTGFYITPSLNNVTVSGGSLAAGNFGSITIGSSSCSVTSYLGGFANCSAAIELLATSGMTLPVTVGVASGTVTASGGQPVYVLSNVTYMNPGKQLKGASITPAVAFNSSLPSSVTPADLLAGFSLSIGNATCSAVSATATGFSCASTTLTDGGDQNVTLTTNGYNFNSVATQQVVDVTNGIAFEPPRALVSSTVPGFTVTVTLNAGGSSDLVAADITNMTLSQGGTVIACTPVFSGSGSGPYTLTCLGGNPTLTATVGTYNVAATILGQDLSAAATLSAISITPTPSALTYDIGSTLFTVQLGTVPSGSLDASNTVLLSVAGETCTSSVVNDSVGCNITFSAVGTYSVNVTVLGATVSAGTFTIRPRISANQTSSLAVNSTSVSFAVTNVASVSDVTAVNLSGGSYSATCSPTALTSGTLTCTASLPLPVQGTAVSAQITAYGYTTGSVQIGTTLDILFIDSFLGRDLAVGLTNLVITGSSMFSPSAVDINGLSVPFTTGSNEVTVSISSLITAGVSWTIGTTINVNITSSGQQSGVTTIGVVAANPTIVPTPGATATGPTTRTVTVTGTNLGADYTKAALSSVVVGGSACTLVFASLVPTSFQCTMSALTAGTYDVAVIMAGGYSVTGTAAVTFAAPLAVTVGSDAVSYLPGANNIIVTTSVAGFISSDISISLTDVNNNTLPCTSSTIDGSGNAFCSITLSASNAGMLSAMITSGGATSARVVIGYLHGGTPAVTANSPVPLVALRVSSFAFQSAYLYADDYSRNVLTLTSADNTQLNCTVTSATMCDLPAAPTSDLASGDVTVVSLFSDGYSATGLSVKIATVMTPIVIIIEYWWDAALPPANLTAIETFIETALNLTAGSIRVETSNGPQRARGVFFLSVTPTTPAANESVSNDPTFAAPGGILANAMAYGAPGATGVVLGATAPVNQPANAPASGGVAPNNGVLTPTGPLSPGAIAGIAVACVGGAALIGLVLFLVFRRKGSKAGKPSPNAGQPTGAPSVAKPVVSESESNESVEVDSVEVDEEESEEDESGEEESGEASSEDESSDEEESGEKESEEEGQEQEKSSSSGDEGESEEEEEEDEEESS